MKRSKTNKSNRVYLAWRRTGDILNLGSTVFENPIPLKLRTDTEACRELLSYMIQIYTVIVVGTAWHTPLRGLCAIE